MKQLTQADFDNAPCWINSAAIDSDGKAYFYECHTDDLSAENIRGAWDVMVGNDCCLFFGEYDATDWQNSAIDRER